MRLENKYTNISSLVSNTITNLKTTMKWTWVHVNEDNRDTLKQYILQQLQVS